MCTCEFDTNFGISFGAQRRGSLGTVRQMFQQINVENQFMIFCIYIYILVFLALLSSYVEDYYFLQ